MNPVATKLKTAQVAAVRGKDLYAMTREVLEALGGIETIVHPNETVFIKPNMVSLSGGANANPFVTGECTKPEIIIAVAEECLRAGASQVIIGDGSQAPSFDWKYATTLDKSTNLVIEAQRLSSKYKKEVKLACLETDSPGWVEVPVEGPSEKIAISTLLTQADRVITIPVMKTHRWAIVSLAMKNFYGIAGLRKYGWTEGVLAEPSEDGEHKWKVHPRGDRILMHTIDGSPEGIARKYFGMTKAVKPDLAIIDGSICLEGNGPCLEHGAKTLDVSSRLGSWLLLASTDIVAADATAARVMNHDVLFVDRILSKACEQGLGGVIHKDSIEILGDRLDALRMEWLPAEPA